MEKQAEATEYEVRRHETGKNETKNQKEEEVGNEEVLKFLDSMDDYLTLFDSLSSTLRQGWLELASARHSMGSLRVNSALLDLNSHTASTSLLLNGDSGEENSRFILQKWGPFDSRKYSSAEDRVKEGMSLEKYTTSHLRHRGDSQHPEWNSMEGDAIKVDDPAKKERSKSLSMFGTLVSPKLRAAQLSFETALETLVEIANTRSILLSTFDQVREKLEVAETMN